MYMCKTFYINRKHLIIRRPYLGIKFGTLQTMANAGSLSQHGESIRHQNFHFFPKPGQSP